MHPPAQRYSLSFCSPPHQEPVWNLRHPGSAASTSRQGHAPSAPQAAASPPRRSVPLNPIPRLMDLHIPRPRSLPSSSHAFRRHWEVQACCRSNPTSLPAVTLLLTQVWPSPRQMARLPISPGQTGWCPRKMSANLNPQHLLQRTLWPEWPTIAISCRKPPPTL